MKNPESHEGGNLVKTVAALAIGALAVLAAREIDWDTIGSSIAEDPWNINH